MSVRCDLTDLLVDQCAHCLGHRAADEIDYDTVRVSTEISARFDGRCALDARHPIEQGDRIGQTEHGWICPACTSKSRPAR